MSNEIVQGMEFSEPFWSFDKPIVYVDMDMDHRIDPHEYHDAPGSICFWLTVEDMEKLVAILQDRIAKAKDVKPPEVKEVKNVYSDEQLASILFRWWGNE